MLPELASTTTGSGIEEMYSRMLEDVANPQPGKRIRVQQTIEGRGNQVSWVAEPSTFAPWIGKNVGVPRTQAGAERLRRVLDLIIAKEPIPPKDQRVADLVRKHAEANWRSVVGEPAYQPPSGAEPIRPPPQRAMPDLTGAEGALPSGEPAWVLQEVFREDAERVQPPSGAEPIRPPPQRAMPDLTGAEPPPGIPIGAGEWADMGPKAREAAWRYFVEEGNAPPSGPIERPVAPAAGPVEARIPFVSQRYPRARQAFKDLMAGVPEPGAGGGLEGYVRRNAFRDIKYLMSDETKAKFLSPEEMKQLKALEANRWEPLPKKPPGEILDWQAERVPAGELPAAPAAGPVAEPTAVPPVPAEGPQGPSRAILGGLAGAAAIPTLQEAFAPPGGQEPSQGEPVRVAGLFGGMPRRLPIGEIPKMPLWQQRLMEEAARAAAKRAPEVPPAAAAPRPAEAPPAAPPPLPVSPRAGTPPPERPPPAGPVRPPPAAPPDATNVPRWKQRLDAEAAAAKKTAALGGERTTMGYSYAAEPKLTVWEKMGPAGEEVSRKVQEAYRLTTKIIQEMDKKAGNLLDSFDSLTPEELDNFRRVKEEQASPMNETVRATVEKSRLLDGPDGLWEQAAREIAELTNGMSEARNFMRREDFFPHEFTPEYRREVIKENSFTRNRAIQQLMEKDPGLDEANASIMLDEYFRAPMTKVGRKPMYLNQDRIVGGLERMRDLDLEDYIKDPKQAYGIRMHKIAERLSQLREWGSGDDIIGRPSGVLERTSGGETMPATGLIGKIQEERGIYEAKRAYKLFKNMIEDTANPASREWANAINRFGAHAYLSLAGIMNSIQGTGAGALRTDFSSALRGTARSVFKNPEARVVARDVGLGFQSAIQDLYNEMGIGTQGGVSRFILKGYDASTRASRFVASNVADVWAHKMADQLVTGTGRKLEQVRRELKNSNFSPDEIAQRMQERTLSAEDIDRIRFSAAEQIEFPNRKARRSELLETPAGSVVGQFTGFAMNSARLIEKSVYREARAGNYKPLAVLLLALPAVGEVPADLRAIARGTERPDVGSYSGIAKRWIQNAAGVIGFSVAGEMLMQISERGEAAWTGLGGPVPGLAARAVTHTVLTGSALAQGDTRTAGREAVNVARQGVGIVPYVGPYIAQQLREDPKAQRIQGETIPQRLGVDDQENALRRREEVGRRGRQMLQDARQLYADGKQDEAMKMVEDFNQANGAIFHLVVKGEIKRRQMEEAQPGTRRYRAIPPGARQGAPRPGE
jgi:hypothetical protein